MALDWRSRPSHPLLALRSLDRKHLPRWGIAVGASAILAALLALGAPFARPASAGGGPENVVLIVDPAQPDALEAARFYQGARGIPGRNMIFMPPGAADYGALTEVQLPAFQGELTARGIDDHVDYVVLPPGSPYFVSADGLVDPGPCPAAFRRIALASAYTLAPEADEILSGGLSVREPNRFYSFRDEPVAFDARTDWYGGAASTSPDARRYYLGWALGYSGARGNTLVETKAMITRSVAVDGMRPGGTFYFMKTTDRARSGPREFLFLAARDALVALGAKAEIMEAVLPVGRHDALGIMTGVANPKIEEADVTLLPGSFADHLTSFAANFGAGQMKVSSWVRSGASGSLGTVQEPCNMAGKFPNPRVFVWYYQGMSLGEAVFRSLALAPFHGMPYGDPLTQPFVVRPTLTVQVPAEPARGVIRIPFQTAMPGGEVDSVELLVDGVRLASARPGSPLVLDTRHLADGHHTLLAVAREASPVEAQGLLRGQLVVANGRHRVSAKAAVSTGDENTVYAISATADAPADGQAPELRLMDGERVLATGRGPEAQLPVLGRALGVGSASLRVEALYTDGTTAQSPAVEIGVAAAAPDAPAPDFPRRAFPVTADVVPGRPSILDLPFMAPAADARAVALAEPRQGTLAWAGDTTILRPRADATGSDEVSFVVSDTVGASLPATATIRYCPAPRVVAPPRDTVACAGTTAVLGTSATGGGLTYQWYREGRPIPGAQGPRLEIPSAGAADAGSYQVVIRNWCRRGANAIPTTGGDLAGAGAGLPLRLQRQP